jgi:hypothetical protein
MSAPHIFSIFTDSNLYLESHPILLILFPNFGIFHPIPTRILVSDRETGNTRVFASV